jgi:putative two-component system response regulator
VADVYDALTSRRVYKEAYGHERTRSMMIGEAGTHFDPVMIDAFIAQERHFMAVRQQYADADDAVPPTEEKILDAAAAH